MKKTTTWALVILYMLTLSCASQTYYEDDEFSVPETTSTEGEASLDDLGGDSASAQAVENEITSSPKSEQDEFAELENDTESKALDQKQAAQEPTLSTEDQALEDELNNLSKDQPVAQEPATPPAPTEELSLDQAPSQDVASQTPPAADSSELSLDEPQAVAEKPSEVLPDQVIGNQSTELAPPAPEVATETMPMPVVEPEPTPVAATPVEITALNYKANDNGGTIVIEASGPFQYSVRKNESLNQIVVEAENVNLPNKFRRTLNTKDMVGTIGAIDAYQNKDSHIARFVIQMRGPHQDLAIQQEGNSLLLVGEGPISSTSVATTDLPSPSNNLNSSSDDSALSETANKEPLQARTLEEFLNAAPVFTGKKISVEMQAPVVEVIRFIMEESGANIIIDDSVLKAGDSKVSFKLREVPWDQALVTILKMKGLAYARQGNVLRVTTQADLESEQKKLDELQQNKTVASYKVRMFPLSYAKPAEIRASISEFLTKDKGKVITDVNTNSIIVTDSEDNLAKIEKVIKVLDVAPAQVLIESRIVEAQDTFTRSLGVNWSFSGSPYEISKNSTGGAINLTPNASFQPGISGVGNSINLNVGILDIFGNLDATLTLGEKEDRVRVVSSPRVVTLNNQTANIEQKEVLNFPVSAPSGVSGVPTSSYQTIEAPLSLGVTPSVSNDGAVTMKIDVKRAIFGAPSGSAPPPVQTRSASTNVIVKDGQTTVIGGIFSSNEVNGVAGMPGLKDVPVLGALFRGKSTTKTKNELLIFVTPKILSRFNIKGVSDPLSSPAMNPSMGSSAPEPELEIQ